jgi:glycosyltransferase involved in cell wall biosynthesis
MITVITPTYKRPKEIIERAVGSLRTQTYKDWIQIICSDGIKEEIPEQIAKENNGKVIYTWTQKSYNDYGPGVRSEMLNNVESEYVCFFDDDNILMPTYLEKMINAIEENDVDFAICHCLHYGPLPQHFGKPPAIVTGIPPKLQNIDTIQIVCKTKIIQETGWQMQLTYQLLGQKYKYVEVPEVLALHM